MSRPVIFISHAGSETSEAQNLARRLEAANIPTILDRFQLRPGDDFVAFMDEALTRSDYCLLLWSRTAASRSYVQAEYRAAFARESVQRRIFVLVARLHDHPPPPLLRSRICVDLFPNFAEGAQKLIDFWQGDYSVAERLGKPVVPTPFPPEECELTGQDSSSTLPTSTAQAVPVVNDVREVYVTSELFDCTLPLFVNLAQPAGVLLERVRHRLDLPREIGVRSSIGLRLSLALLYRTNVLEKTSSLRAQGITGGSVVTLELTVTPFAEAEPVRTESGRQVFRSGTELNDLLLKLLLQRGLKAS